MLLSMVALAVLAAGSIHCGGGAAPERSDCLTAEDCEGFFGGVWSLDCDGRYACTAGSCEQVCDSEGCGDGLCATAGGETEQSCPPDCGAACEVAADCAATGEWDAPCDGRWDCQSQGCVEVCDYDVCGNGSCDTNLGENEDSCTTDCVEGCRTLFPSDCFSEQWAPMAICQGRWNCLQGTCQRICDDDNCGNGICWGLNGENEDSCFVDCLGGPCEELIDCLGQRWYKTGGGVQPSCQGHWQCNPPSRPEQAATGACEAICDDEPGGGCGDGTCDTLNGETPTSCLVDCQSGYSCTKSSDCNALTLPDGCTGDWICASQLCVPQCE